MKLAFSVPALAAGALLAAVSFTTPAYANNDRAKQDRQIEQNVPLEEAMALSFDLICPAKPANANLFGPRRISELTSVAPTWFLPGIDLSRILKDLENDQLAKSTE